MRRTHARNGRIKMAVFFADSESFTRDGSPKLKGLSGNLSCRSAAHVDSVAHFKGTSETWQRLIRDCGHVSTMTRTWWLL